MRTPPLFVLFTLLLLLTAASAATSVQDKLLRFDHQERLTCKEAMAHPYFNVVREREQTAMSS